MVDEIEPQDSEQLKPPITEERKHEIAHHFSNSGGVLVRDEIDDLQTLDVEDIFSTLTSAEPVSKHGAIFSLRHFPSVEAVELLNNLYTQEEFKKEQDTITFILFGFAHNPQVSQEAISALRTISDPRVVSETKMGEIKMALPDEVDEFLSLAPRINSQREWALKSAGEGAFFTSRSKTGEPVCFAIAHQMKNYILYLDYIFTAGKHRRQGYGREMIRYLLDKHMVSECHLFNTGDLSEKTLENIGFIKQPSGPWVFRREMKKE